MKPTEFREYKRIVLSRLDMVEGEKEMAKQLEQEASILKRLINKEV